MKTIAIALLLAAMPCLQAEEMVSRVFELKHASANRVRDLLFGFHALRTDEQLKTIAVQAPKSAMEEIEQTIKRFDVPPPPIQNVEVTIYLMSALAQPVAAPIPPELEGVVKQLKGMFSYKAYQMIDTQVIRVRAGQGGEASGVIDGGPSLDGIKTISQVRFKSASASVDSKGSSIRIDELKVGLRIPVGVSKSIQYFETGFSTNVDIHEGQKVVVGKANMDGSDRASIVVLTAKVVE